MPAFCHPGFRRWIRILSLFIRLRIEMSNLQVWNKCETDPREGERPEDSENKRRETFHQCATSSSVSGSTGFKNVGTLAVRPRPNSINPK